MREGPNGAFYNHQFLQDGKNVSHYLPRDQVEGVQNAIDGYARFQSLIEDYVDLKVGQTRAELAAGLKKKRMSQPRSPSRRPPKSSS